MQQELAQRLLSATLDWSDEEIEIMLGTARGVNIRKLRRL